MHQCLPQGQTKGLVRHQLCAPCQPISMFCSPEKRRTSGADTTHHLNPVHYLRKSVFRSPSGTSPLKYSSSVLSYGEEFATAFHETPWDVKGKIRNLRIPLLPHSSPVPQECEGFLLHIYFPFLLLPLNFNLQLIIRSSFVGQSQAESKHRRNNNREPFKGRIVLIKPIVSSLSMNEKEMQKKRKKFRLLFR